MMNNLISWQEDFTQSLLGDLLPHLQESFDISSTAMSQEAQQQRFAIYQNNVFFSLSNALGDLYPVVKKLVGEDFFTGTASYYLREHPPQQAAMVHFGHDFNLFLEHFEHTQSMPYLAHVATLELARHKAYHAKDCQSLTAESFQSITPERLALSQLQLHPSLQLLAANYPIFSIWQANQDDNQEQKTISLDEPQQVLVVRPMYEVALYTIDVDTYNFINLLHQGEIFQVAVENTLKNNHEWDVGLAIQFLIHEQLIIDVTKSN